MRHSTLSLACTGVSKGGEEEKGDTPAPVVTHLTPSSRFSTLMVLLTHVRGAGV